MYNCSQSFHVVCGFAIFYFGRQMEEGINNKWVQTCTDQRTCSLLGNMLHVSIKSVMLTWNINLAGTIRQYSFFTMLYRTLHFHTINTILNIFLVSLVLFMFNCFAFEIYIKVCRIKPRKIKRSKTKRN